MTRRATTKKDTTLCLNFCTYYKPGRNEELACEGYLVVQRLVRAGMSLSQERPPRRAKPDAKTLAGLRERVCSRCSFRENDCDYSASGGTADACGGLALLSYLLGRGDLVLEDID